MATLAHPPVSAPVMTSLAEIVRAEGLSLPAETGAFIDGAAVRGGGAALPVIYPATDEPVTTLIEAEPALAARAVASARAAFEEGPWPRLKVAERKAILLKVRDTLAAHGRELGVLQMLETGLPLRQVMAGHVARTLDNFEFFGDVAATLAGQTFQQTGTYLSVVTREPVGVAAIFAPWNAPLVLSSMKLAAALALGNTVVLKPSEFTPLSVMRMVELMHEAGVPAGVVNLVNGGGAVTGRALSEHPDIDAVGFIGSTATGRAIMTAAAQRIGKVGLELGGKSANIVFEDADLPLAIGCALGASVALQSGQACIAGTRLLVQRSIYKQVVEQIEAAAGMLKVGDPMEADTVMGPIISDFHCRRILDSVERFASTGGGTAVVRGGRLERDGFFLGPTVFSDVDPASSLAQDEIFGPVLAIIPFDTEDDAVRIANHSRYGLAGYVFTQHLGRALRVADRLEAGTISINGPNFLPVNLPFGGVKASGFGREGGLEGIHDYTYSKGVQVALPH